mmetsp:Transcript_62699/g.144374  ORF Transcript_62699/g.144374 Transcript_62699/m.144374 type:complete len:150 (-) Transcript_62699:113-562(-)
MFLRKIVGRVPFVPARSLQFRAVFTHKDPEQKILGWESRFKTAFDRLASGNPKVIGVEDFAKVVRLLGLVNKNRWPISRIAEEVIHRGGYRTIGRRKPNTPILWVRAVIIQYEEGLKYIAAMRYQEIKRAEILQAEKEAAGAQKKEIEA